MNKKIYDCILRLVLFLALTSNAFAQTREIKGQIRDSDSKQPLSGASVVLLGTTMGAAADQNGNYSIKNVPAGSYDVRVTYLGYVSQQKSVTIDAASITLDFSLLQTTLQANEVIVEVNRAKERETPVAFTNVGKEQIEERIHGQDAPLLLKGTPGLYAYSTDGVGNGESKLFVRGFNQNYVQVLINGIPTNDPESNAVYWSNWGSVSSAAASVQIQRGAGSSLYGAGSFGGSFNIVTGNAKPRPFYGVNLSLGSPQNTMYGVDINTGLIDNTYAVSVRLDRKLGEGNRLGARYEGTNYYFSGSWYINNEQSLKFVLHGAPQVHGYSFSNDISYFKYFDYKANSAPWLWLDAVNKLPASGSGKANYGLTDGVRELIAPDYVTLSHNHFHKPQAELHYSYDLGNESAIHASVFYSMGRGGGSSLNSSGSPTNAQRDPDGSIRDTAVIRNVYLRTATTATNNAYQRDSYSLHQQGGILANYETKINDDLKLTVGAEFRSWTADHPGHFTNLYGQTFLSAQQYGRVDTNGANYPTTSNTFRRRTFEGDVDQTNDVALFGWTMKDDNGTYNTQYRNYRGETPQYTLFANASYRMSQLTFTGTLQYVWYKYTLIENMPSENAIGRRLTFAQIAAQGLIPKGATSGGKDEGRIGDKFYIKEMSSSTAANATVRDWYEFDLVNATRSRGFLQPKFGVNYNLDENLNVFGNFAHVERFVDLGVYYNQGRVNDQAGDEKSNQFEAGIGWTSKDLNAKLNAYSMTWDNKSARIQDQSQAGMPGFDRNGFRTILVGSSSNNGVEFEFNTRLDNLLPISGLNLRASASISQNKWTDVLPEVKTDPSTGKRQVFNSGGRDANGNIDTVFIDELSGTHAGGPPQTMVSVGFTYKTGDFFAGVDGNYYADHYGLDGDTYARVDGSWDATKTTFTYIVDQKLPSRWVWDGQAGYRYSFMGIRGMASFQILNLFDTKYLADMDNFGVIPGNLRSYRFNLNIGM